MAINLKRVLVGGLVAGLTVAVCGAALVPIVGDEMREALSRLRLPPLTPGAMAYFGLVSLVIGLVLVWLYAALQPRR
ncbi:MAG TPA: hypothetical protein VFQ35_01525, partial [Polyangiaceae bacterium]|nr:hypothetical protein [Polyangiaceae bacterium]